MLKHYQESWERPEGFDVIRVKSRNPFSDMLPKLWRERYDITMVDSRETHGDSRNHFLRWFRGRERNDL